MVRRPAMAFVVAPAVVAAGWPRVRILRCHRGRATVRDLCLVGLIGTLVGLSRSRGLVHALLRPAPVTAASTAATSSTNPSSSAAAATATVMHRPLSRTSRLTSQHHLLPRSLHPNPAWRVRRDFPRTRLDEPRCRAAFFARVHPHCCFTNLSTRGSCSLHERSTCAGSL